MFFMLEDVSFQQYTPRLGKCGNFCTILSFIVGFFTLMIIFAVFSVDLTQRIHVVYINQPGLGYGHTTDEKFLSIALDSSIIANGFKNLDFNDPKMIKMMSAFSPAYLRIGGTMADRLTFSTSKSFHFKHSCGALDGGECSYDEKYCDYLQKPNFTMNAIEWLKLNKLAKKTGLTIIFDLNVLKRFDNGSWDYGNAEKLIHFSAQHDLDVGWELGNEPNSFRHQFNYEVPAHQLSQDFQTLRTILNSHEKYKNCLLVGPDVTRPRLDKNSSQLYLKEFLSTGDQSIDAVTWHQYCFDGKTASVRDFLDPKNFDVLQWEISTVKNIVAGEGIEKPIWLGETASAYGGGAPHLSDRYVSTFLWLDKLGRAAKNGLNVVIRQSIFQGNYALINDRYLPTPDWWVSILHKKLVGNKTVNCHFPGTEKLRLYCQCTQRRSRFEKSSVTVFGINIHNRKAKIRFEGITLFDDKEAVRNLKVHAYVLTTRERIDSRFIFLNGKMLKLTASNDVPNLLPEVISAYPYVEMPPYSSAFWVVPMSGNIPFNC